MNWGMSLFVIAVFILFIWSLSQTRFKNKMLCRFRRPNHQLIEKWVPLEAKYVIFDNKKSGVGQYTIDPRCIQNMWYDRGINKLFPTLIPTMDFRFDTPYPLNPESFEVTWQTPEVLRAAWQEHNAQEFAKGVGSQGGVKKKEKFGIGIFIALVAIALVIIVGFLWYRNSAAMAKNMNDLNNRINTISGGVVTTTPIK